jgi:hypothetical protein
VLAVLQHGLAGRLGIRERRRVDMDHGLIAIARCTGIDTMVQHRLRQQSQGVGMLLLQRGVSAETSPEPASSKASY